MLEALSLGQHQLPPWTHTSIGVNMSSYSPTPPLNESGSFQTNIKTKDTGLYDNNRTNDIGITSLLLSQLMQTTPSLSEEPSGSSRTHVNLKREHAPENDPSVFIKISLLLFVTAFVLMASYKFVVHLFVGYSDRKDDYLGDSCSEDEDLTGMKKHPGPILDIG